MIELGNKVKDKVTGFTGIAVGKCIYLNGCIQYEVKPLVNKAKEMAKGAWIDEAQLELVDQGILPESKPRKPSGGKRDHPRE